MYQSINEFIKLKKDIEDFQDINVLSTQLKEFCEKNLMEDMKNTQIKEIDYKDYSKIKIRYTSPETEEDEREEDVNSFFTIYPCDPTGSSREGKVCFQEYLLDEIIN